MWSIGSILDRLVMGNILEWYNIITDTKLWYQNIPNIFPDKNCRDFFSFELFVSIIFAMFGWTLFELKGRNLIPGWSCQAKLRASIQSSLIDSRNQRVEYITILSKIYVNHVTDTVKRYRNIFFILKDDFISRSHTITGGLIIEA